MTVNKGRLIALTLLLAVGGGLWYLVGVTAEHNLPPTIHLGRVEDSDVLPVTQWRISGPYLDPANRWKYLPDMEAQIFNKDFLRPLGGSETDERLPMQTTNISIDLTRDISKEPETIPAPEVTLNQNVEFGVADVSSQLLFWGTHHEFKVVYAHVDIDSALEQKVVLLIGANSPVQLRVNGAVAYQSYSGSVGADWYTNGNVLVPLKRGLNHVLIKAFWFPKRNDFAVWVTTPTGARNFIRDHGGMFDVLTRILVPRTAGITVNPALRLFGENSQQYVIRDITGNVVREGELAEKDFRSPIPISGPPGLYYISVGSSIARAREMFYLGDPKDAVDDYRRLCSRPNAPLPCDSLTELIKLIQEDGAFLRLDKEKVILSFMEQFEFALHDIRPGSRLPDAPPLKFLMAFQSRLNGSRQYYFLFLPSGGRSHRPPLVIVQPYNTSDKPFFESYPATSGALEKYLSFGEEYHLALAFPYNRGLQIPSSAAEADSEDVRTAVLTQFGLGPEKVYLAGECAGGRSAILLAEEHPSEYAAISTIAPGTGMNVARTFSRRDAANALLRLAELKKIPLRVVQGRTDAHSPAEAALLLEREAARSQVKVETVWLPGNGLFVRPDSVKEMLSFFATAAVLGNGSQNRRPTY
ncbi:alpha/beta hydrolase family protein [Terriglobus sp. ADX1]|uniref:alpha/beta hydrolase family protein n=1 Tax=Terriglobus sp. ADX1 TaxID=2794063 RepID=UPI002FE5649A